MKINFLKEIEILSAKVTITWHKKHDGAEFSWEESTIKIGMKSYHKDPIYTFACLAHELMEMILVAMGARYQNQRDGSYLFNLTHQTFENAIQIHTQAITKFILK